MNFVEKKQKTKLELLNSKGAEYSKNDNRFHNFDIAKKLYDLIDNKDTPYFVYYANLCKQFTGIIDILNGKDYTLELLAEKFGDCENYLTLLEAKLTFDLDNKRNFNLEDLGDFRVEPKPMKQKTNYDNIDLRQEPKKQKIKKHQIWVQQETKKFVEVINVNEDNDIVTYSYSGYKQHYHLDKVNFTHKFRFVNNYAKRKGFFS